MKSVLSQDKGIDLGEATIATMPVAVLRMEPDELTSTGVLSFREGFDDLDYLVFAMLSLPSGREVTLVRHANAPNPGTEVCVVPEEKAIASSLRAVTHQESALAILETVKTLNLTVADLSWIHPDYAEAVMDEQGAIDFVTETTYQKRQLVSFVNASQGLTIGFIESNFKPDTNAVLEALQQDPTCQEIQFEVLNFPDPQLRFLRDLIVKALQNLQVPSGKKLVLIIRGLEQSIGMTGDYPPILQDLNFVRDDFVKSIPHPLLFCLPDYAITRLARYAPDFWAWKSGLFRFQTSPRTQVHALSHTLDSEQIHGSLGLAEKQERIDLLQRLLMEYQPSGHGQTQANIKTCLQILNELGVLYRSQGDVVKAEKMFQDALAQITDEPELLSIKATVLHELGVLRNNLGKSEEAIALYKQSLELHERIGDVRGKAATLHQMAGIYADRGEVEQAIALYQQSLELKKRIGDVQGKAATLHQMAGIYADRGEVEQAIALYQQSLELKERIGNVQGKAATLVMMAQLLATQGEFNRAIKYTHESLGILTHLKSPDAANVQSILLSILLASPHGEQIQQLLSQGDREGIQTLIQQIVQAEP
ncbi:tetratricopeptide repeat protein [Altericista sp. CCNU0014]|uniref:tetratricopeptide repeat protein n=1 Tax=Altericista sp. CCNU0014 TaxID=3082949 RepID=UPI00384C3EBF